MTRSIIITKKTDGSRFFEKKRKKIFSNKYKNLFVCECNSIDYNATLMCFSKHTKNAKRRPKEKEKGNCDKLSIVVAVKYAWMCKLIHTIYIYVCSFSWSFEISSVYCIVKSKTQLWWWDTQIRNGNGLIEIISHREINFYWEHGHGKIDFALNANI